MQVKNNSLRNWFRKVVFNDHPVYTVVYGSQATKVDFIDVANQYFSGRKKPYVLEVRTTFK